MRRFASNFVICILVIMSVDMISLQVELHKTQVAAEAAVGQGSVKVFKLKFKLIKNKTFFTIMFVSVQQQWTSKIMTESVENHSVCCGCVNSCNKFVSTRSC